MAPLVLPSYWTMRISRGLVLPCSPGSLSNDGVAKAGRRRTRPNVATQKAERERVMGYLRSRFDAPPARRIYRRARVALVRERLRFQAMRSSIPATFLLA